MIEISLTQNKVALVDDEDYELVSSYKWCANKDHHYDRWYAVVNLPRNKGKQKQLKMHRLILNAKQGQKIDHVDGNGLNNTRENIRFCTTAQNGFNRQKPQNCSSVYKGVCWNKAARKWKANIRVNYRWLYLGSFNSELEAAKAYDEAAIKYFGKFSKLNLGGIDAFSDRMPSI